MTKETARHERIYLDHNATTPIHPSVRENLLHWTGDWGNASSIHWAGRGPKAAIRETRQKLADLLGVHPLELIFTSGGSEANNFAIKGVFESLNPAGSQGAMVRSHYLLSSVEHPSVRKAMEQIQRRGAQIDIIPVSRQGQIDLERLALMITEKTALVSVMMAHNETGVIFPIKKMAKLAHEKGALFHTDAVQALGKIPLNLASLGVDLASFAGHKFYALKGVGVLFARRGLDLNPLISGGGQERQRRAGTENTLAIRSLGFMMDLTSEIAPQSERLCRLRDEFEIKLEQEISGVSFTAREAKRLPNTSNVVIDGVDGETLLMNLDLAGYAVSTGAACSSGSQEPSPSLIAMGLSFKEAQSSLRISLGWQTSEWEMASFRTCLVEIIKRLRANGSGERFEELR